MPRGGARSGTPGKSYRNRTDLPGKQPVKAGPSKEYGQRAEQERAQSSLSLPAVAPTPTAAPAGAPAPGGPTRTIVPMDAPSQRPAEPVTAGLPFGAGPGPEALDTPDPTQDLLTKLRAVYTAVPLPEIAELIAEASS